MTTEELKREMYLALANAKGRITIHYSIKDELRGIDEFENALENYLGSLSKDLNFACSCVDLSALKAAKLIEERDQLRSKLQAFEFANKSAGELLIHAQETIRKQRQFIRTLYTSRKARKARPGTLAQSSEENVADVTCGGNAQPSEAISKSYTGFPIVCRAEFDDRIRTTCSACHRVTEVWK